MVVLIVDTREPVDVMIHQPALLRLSTRVGIAQET